jgi:indole-3-glycerol phosphate synthase
MASAVDYLGPILERKRRENARRLTHRGLRPSARLAATPDDDRERQAVARLRRAPGSSLRVIAEIKLRSPSAGVIRAYEAGVVTQIAREYAQAGAAAVSVLCDGPGFGGSPLDLRRAARAVGVPLLFKEFVLHPIQIALARELGAHMVLLIVRALERSSLGALVDEVLRQGMAPVVEAADERELELALETRATIIGVNARDLRSFQVDPDKARRALELVPDGRIAVHMSGITSADELVRASGSRADAVLVGEALMRAPSGGTPSRPFGQKPNGTRVS